jgi:transposase InsO family protein
MVAFIDAHRGALGVEPICSQLPIAPSTYYAHKACQENPALRSKRAQRDEWLAGEITRVRAENFDAYGAYKVWRQLRREGVVVARCTVERLMRQLGLRGVVRGRAFTRPPSPRQQGDPRISSIGTSWPRARTSCGWPISRTWRPGTASCTSRS